MLYCFWRIQIQVMAMPNYPVQESFGFISLGTDNSVNNIFLYLQFRSLVGFRLCGVISLRKLVLTLFRGRLCMQRFATDR